MPLGWSFLSIAKVPMSWTPGDVWTCEIELPAGTRVEYKYVILEEQVKKIDGNIFARFRWIYLFLIFKDRLHQIK